MVLLLTRKLRVHSNGRAWAAHDTAVARATNLNSVTVTALTNRPIKAERRDSGCSSAASAGAPGPAEARRVA